MTQSDFIRELEILFEMEPNSIDLASRFQEFHDWNSLTFLGLLALADEQLGISISPQQLLACETVEDILDLVGTKIEVG